MIAVSIAALAASAFVTVDDTAPETVQRLLDAYAGQHQAWRITYEIGTPEQSERLYRSLAQRRGGFFTHAARKSVPGIDPDDDPRRQSLVIDGHTAVIARGHEGAVQVEPASKERLPGTAAEDIFFFVTGWWCDPDVQPPMFVNGTPLVFADFARRREFAVVGRETVSGLDTVIIDGRTAANVDAANTASPLVDRVWLATDAKHGMVQRRVFNEETGLVVQEMRVLDFADSAERIWPAQVAIERIMPDTGEPQQSVMHVTACAFDDEVPATDFVPRITSDTTVYGPDRMLLGVTTETGAFADTIVAWSLRWAAPTQSDHPPDRPRSGVAAEIGVFVLVAALTAGIGWMIPRRLGRTPPLTPMTAEHPASPHQGT